MGAGTALWWRLGSTGASRPQPITANLPAPQANDKEPEPASTDRTTITGAAQEPVALAEIPTAPTEPSVQSRPVVAGPAADTLAKARQALAAGDLVQARQLFNAAFAQGLPEPLAREVIRELEKLADETLFSPKVYKSDPLVGFHLVDKGETLAKIAKRYKVTVQLLARINKLRNPNLIRYKQRLKVIHGPFNVVVDKSDFKMFVYCQDTLVRVFPVGLGMEGTTPTGLWRVKNKLENPTYYPPRGGKIIQADDPNNPLGEHWIGLEGIEGEAKGQERYGIHGTIEPESIGKNVSLGCIRMYNKDVAFLFDLLTVGNSLVKVRE